MAERLYARTKGRFLAPGGAVAARVIGLILAALLAGGAGAARVWAAPPTTLVSNGNLTRGSGNAPDSWRSTAWKLEFATFSWHHSATGPGELEVDSTQPNDAFWAQTLHLAQGWYHFTASVRSLGVSQAGSGASLSIVEDGITSEQLHGSTDWTTVGFFLKVGEAGANVELACRLGSFASLSRGSVFCRDIKAVPTGPPPAGESHQYDLDQIRSIAALSARVATGRATSAGRIALLILIGAAVLLLVAFLGGRTIVAGARSRPAAEAAAQPLEAAEPPRPALRAAQPMDRRALLAVAAAVVLEVALAIRRLDSTPYAIDFGGALAGLKTVLPVTGLAALKLWSVWALSSAVVAGLVLQIAPQIELLDAILAGAAGAWVFAYLIGQTLGPIGLFRPLTIWILLLAGAVQIWRRPPRIPRTPLSAGQKLALLALGLLAVGMLPMQLGSPVAPYMDVLGCPASVQRILSFGVYLPFDNDPYGCFGARAQTPSLELLLAMLAMAGRVKLGVLAQSATMLPMAVLIMFATYRLGLTLAGDTAGGVAALLLFFTVIWRRTAGMRGTAVAFALVALGLAFFLDRRRNRTLIALGALILGTSVAVHAIDGGLAMLTAAAGALLWLADGDSERFVVSVVCLAGATLFAVPELAIGLARPVAYPLLPLSQLAGVVLIVIGVRRLRDRGAKGSALRPRLGGWMVVILVAAVMYQHATSHDSVFEQVMTLYPLLSLLAFAGLAAWATVDDLHDAGQGLAIATFALLLGTAGGFLKSFADAANNEIFRSGVVDIGYKLWEYWCPYFLVFPAAMPFALLYDARVRSRPIVILALLTLLIYPWHPWQSVDYNYTEHSIVEEWGIGLNTARSGFWVGTDDPRWTLNSYGFALVNFLRAERAAGRITAATHILHIAHDAIVWRDFNRFAVFTGIDQDSFVYEILGADIGWFAGSRVRPIAELRQALAERPPYILEQGPVPSWMGNPPDGYEEVFHRGDLRLLRRTPR